MRHPFSLAYLTVPGLSPPEMITVAANAGYDYVGLRLHAVTADEPRFPLAQDPAMLRETQRRLAGTGLRVLDVELLRLTPDFDVTAFSALLDVSAELEARHVIAQAADADIARATDHLAQLCDAAAARGLTVEVEFVTWTETPDLARAASIVTGARRENAGVLVDTLHFSRSNCSVAELAKLPASWFRYVQVCDAPLRAPDSVEGLIHAARNERLFPGEGALDLQGILGALPPAIPYSLEIPRASLARQVGLQECARLALVTARSFLARMKPAAPSIVRLATSRPRQLH